MIVRIVVNGVALWAASVLVPGISLAENEPSTSQRILTVVLIAAIFGLINAVIRPVAKVLGFPFLILTLGLFIFVINAAMLMLTSAAAGALNLAFHVDRFWPTALLGSLVVSFVSWVLGAFFDDDDQRARRENRRYTNTYNGPRGPRLDGR